MAWASAWKVPTGRPNACRVLANASISSRVAWDAPRYPPVMITFSSSMLESITDHPLSWGPTRFSRGTTTSDRYTSLVPRMCRVEVRRTPTLARHILGTNEVYLSDVEQ